MKPTYVYIMGYVSLEEGYASSGQGQSESISDEIDNARAMLS